MKAEYIIMRPIPGVTYKSTQKPVPDQLINKQWQVVLLIIILPFDTCVLFFNNSAL